MRCGRDQNIKDATKLYWRGKTQSCPSHTSSAVECISAITPPSHITSHPWWREWSPWQAGSSERWAPKNITHGDCSRLDGLLKAVPDYPHATSLAHTGSPWCTPSWSPRKKGDIQLLEAKQRSYTRCISGLKELNYWHLLHKLGFLPTKEEGQILGHLHMENLEGYCPWPHTGYDDSLQLWEKLTNVFKIHSTKMSTRENQNTSSSQLTTRPSEDIQRTTKRSAGYYGLLSGKVQSCTGQIL